MALGGALSDAGRHGEAAEVFQRLLAREPLHEDAYRGLMVARASARATSSRRWSATGTVPSRISTPFSPVSTGSR